VVKIYDPQGNLIKDIPRIEIGFSLLAMYITWALLFLAFFVVIGIGYFKRFHLGVPLAGSFSSAISAACHRPDRDTDAHMKPVMWGVPNSNQETNAGDDRHIGHCCLTSENVSPPEVRKRYA
jgi:hypothetical protein